LTSPPYGSAGQSGEGKQAKARPSFLKKRSKKLLSVWASAFPDGLSPNDQRFFGSFFQKRTAFFLCPIALYGSVPGLDRSTRTRV
jgi:hypothetical protein